VGAFVPSGEGDVTDRIRSGCRSHNLFLSFPAGNGDSKARDYEVKFTSCLQWGSPETGVSATRAANWVLFRSCREISGCMRMRGGGRSHCRTGLLTEIPAKLEIIGNFHVFQPLPRRGSVHSPAISNACVQFA
jgi:hypothetical protein